MSSVAACATQQTKPPPQIIKETVVVPPPEYLHPKCEAPIDVYAAMRSVDSLLDAFLQSRSDLMDCALQAQASWNYSTPTPKTK